MSESHAARQFDESCLTDCEPIDWPEFERWIRLTAGQRIQTMLHAHRLAAGLVRGRLRRRYPDASDAEITRLMLAEWQRGS